MSLRQTIVRELRSVAGAAVQCAPIRCSGSRLTVHVTVAPAALVAVQGCATNNPAEFNDLSILDMAVGDYTPANTMAAGHYMIIGRPNWMRIQIADDAGGPRTFRTEISFDVED